MSEQRPEPVSENSVTTVEPPKRSRHPLRGWFIALVIEVGLLVVSVLALGAVAWFSAAPERTNWGPERKVTVTVKIRDAGGTAQVSVGGQTSVAGLNSDAHEVYTWPGVVPFGEGAKVVVALSQDFTASDSWTPRSKITCEISDASGSLSTASVDVVGNSAVCEWTNR